MTTAKKFCNKYFANKKSRKRKFTAILEDIDHQKSGEVMKQPLSGISQLFCFGCFQEKHVVWSRFMSCYCKYCLCNDWLKCENILTVGRWTRNRLILNIYHTTPSG